jgi:Flp pilus assembly protein TadB
MRRDKRLICTSGMAQTKRKRHTKHRGNAAGVVEARGRTGRPPSADEKKRSTRDKRREDRLLRQPTMKSSAQRAVLAAGFMFVFLMFTDKPKHGGSAIGAALIFAIIAGGLYLVLGYYLEMFLWRRRMAKRQQAPAK